MTDEIKLKKITSYITFSLGMLANSIGIFASWGDPSMYVTGLFWILHVISFFVFCIRLKNFDIYLKTVLILFVMILFPLILWFSPNPKQAVLYDFIIPSFYAISIRKKRDLILPVINGLLISGILAFKVSLIYAVIFMAVYSFCVLVYSLFSITLFANFEELEKAYSLITDIARKDQLTGIYNRFGLENAVRNRLEDDCYAIMIDIDFFKQINDRYGHEQGDKVLATLGSILNKFASQDFIVSRWGGEEFLMYSFKDQDETMVTLKAIYDEVEKTLLLEDEHIHISAGVSERGLISDALVSDADKKLYHSKETGRNKITTQLP